MQRSLTPRYVSLLVALLGAYGCNVYTEALLGEAEVGGSETGGEETGGTDTGGGSTGGTNTGGAATGGGGTRTGGTGSGGVPGGAGPSGGRPPTGGAASDPGGSAGRNARGGTSPGGTPGTGGAGAMAGSGGAAGAPATGGVDTGGTATGGTPGECGDGTVQASNDETCDDAGESADCDADCTAVECGDDVINATAGEECEPSLASDCRSQDCKYSYLHHLAHRYSFEGSGTVLIDSVSGADGQTHNMQMTGTGRLELAGSGSNQYGSLPNGLASNLTNATFEVWVRWDGGGDWQRIFDFGSSDAGEPNRGSGLTYLFLCPSSMNAVMHACFSTSGQSGEMCVDAAQPLDSGVDRHVALVIDDDRDTLTLYQDGTLENAEPFTGSLSGLDDFNNWLGLSQFDLDPEFGGAIEEFRIYDAALSASEVMDSFQAGPDA